MTTLKIKIPGKFSFVSAQVTLSRQTFLQRIAAFFGRYQDTSLEVTVPHNNWYARYKGEFQNMGPKMRSLYWQKDRPWMHDLK